MTIKNQTNNGNLTGNQKQQGDRRNQPRNANTGGYQADRRGNQGYQEPKIRQQLRSLTPALLHSSAPASANEWLQDGIDHINISRNSSVRLGQLLNLDFTRHWEHRLFGPFRSLNSLWHFIRAKQKNDDIRGLTGYELKRFVDDECGGYGPTALHFRAVIMHSAYERVKQSQDMVNEMIKSVLPFDCYMTQESGLRRRFDHSLWFSGGYEEIRKALKEGREPNFAYLMDRRDGQDYGDDTAEGIARQVKTIYASALEQMLPKADPARIEAAKAAANEARQQEAAARNRAKQLADAHRAKEAKEAAEAEAAKANAAATVVPFSTAGRIQSIDTPVANIYPFTSPTPPSAPAVTMEAEVEGMTVSELPAEEASAVFNETHRVASVVRNVDVVPQDKQASAVSEEAATVIEPAAHSLSAVEADFDDIHNADTVSFGGYRDHIADVAAVVASEAETTSEVAEQLKEVIAETPIDDKLGSIVQIPQSLAAASSDDVSEALDQTEGSLEEAEEAAPVATAVSEGFVDTRFAALKALAPATATVEPVVAEGRYAPVDGEEGQV